MTLPFLVLMTTWSVRLPVRESTLTFCFRNVSNSEIWKMRSLIGSSQLIVIFCFVVGQNLSEYPRKARRRVKGIDSP